MTSITKISSRPTTGSAQKERITTLLASYSTNPDLEIQQRAVEFANLYALGEIRAGVLERMPAPELKQTVLGYGKYSISPSILYIDILHKESENKPVGSIQPEDLWGGDDVVTNPTTNAIPAATSATDDLLNDIFGSSSDVPVQTAQPAAAPTQPRNPIDDIMGLFGPSSSPAPPAGPTSPYPGSPLGQAQSSPFAATPPQVQSPPIQQQPRQQPQQPRLTSYVAYENNELKVTLTPQTSAAHPGLVNILARFQATGADPITGLNFQAAVPKVFCLIYSQFSHGLIIVLGTNLDYATNVKPRRPTRKCRDAADAGRLRKTSRKAAPAYLVHAPRTDNPRTG